MFRGLLSRLKAFRDFEKGMNHWYRMFHFPEAHALSDWLPADVAVCVIIVIATGTRNEELSALAEITQMIRNARLLLFVAVVVAADRVYRDREKEKVSGSL